MSSPRRQGKPSSAGTRGARPAGRKRPAARGGAAAPVGPPADPVAGSPPAAPDRGLIPWLHLLVFLIPLAMSNFTWLGLGESALTFDQFDLPKVFVLRAIVLLAAGVWLWGSLRGGGGFRWTSTGWLLLAFLAWLAVSTVLSVHLPTAIAGKYKRYDGLLSLLSYAALFFLALQALDTPARVRALARTLVIAGGVVSLYGLLQYLGADPITWGPMGFEANRSFSTFGNPNLLAGYLIFPLGLAPALALSDPSPRWRAGYWIVFALVASCLVTSFTRGAWIGGAIGLLAVSFAALRARLRPQLIDWGLLALGSVAVVAVVLRSLRSGSEVMNVASRLSSVFDFGRGSGRTRTEIWQAALQGIQDRPFFGHGPDSFRLIFPRYKPLEYVADAGHLSVADNAHNYPLQLAAGVGIGGAALLYGFFGWALWRSARASFHRQDSSSLVMAGFWGASLGYLAHLMFGLSVTGSSFLLWLSLGLLLAPGAREVVFRAPRWSRLTLAPAALLLTAAFILNATVLVADRHFLLGSDPRITFPEGIRHTERAIRLNPLEERYRSALGRSHADLALERLTEVNRLRLAGQDATALGAQARQAIDEGARALEKAIRFNSLEYDNYLTLASLYNRAATYLDAAYLDEALHWGERGMEVEPYGPAVRYEVAAALTGMGRTEEAIDQLREAAAMDPRFVDPRVMLGYVLRDQGRGVEAEAAWREALALEPDNEQVRRELQGLVSGD